MMVPCGHFIVPQKAKIEAERTVSWLSFRDNILKDLSSLLLAPLISKRAGTVASRNSVRSISVYSYENAVKLLFGMRKVFV